MSFPEMTTRLKGMGTRMDFEMEFPLPEGGGGSI